MTVLELPWLGEKLMKPLATDLSVTDLFQLAWIQMRASHTVYCRLGGDGIHVGLAAGGPDLDAIRAKLGADGVAVQSLHKIRPSFEDVFLALGAERDRDADAGVGGSLRP